MNSTGWPDLTWTSATPGTPWLLERIRTMAERARAFELALDKASSEGAAPLAPAVPSIEKWDKVVANVWDYAGREAETFAPEDFDFHVEQLQTLWGALGKYRRRILDAVGTTGAAKVQGYEHVVAVTPDTLVDRVSQWAVAQEEIDQLGNVTTSPTLTPKGRKGGRPVSADELKSRNAAESRPLPSPLTLEAALAAHPAPWVHAIFSTLGLEAEEKDGEVTSADSRVAAQRSAILQRLRDEAFLRSTVSSLEDGDRKLLTALLGAPTGVRYAELTREYGGDEADGFYWSERAPSGPLARLRRAGFVTVGGSGDGIVAVIPGDLAEVLRRVVAEQP